MGNDILLALEESRRNGSILKELNNGLIAIIPKVDNPHTFVHFRPISLCNTLYKIFTRALSRRLALLIPKIVLEEQGDLFLEGRLQRMSFLLMRYCTWWCWRGFLLLY